MISIKHLVASLLAGAIFTATAQQAGAVDPGAAQAAAVWKYKTKHLDRGAVDALLARPDSVLLLDLRRPDEQIKYGSFPVYLSIQAKDLEKQLAWLPRDRTIVTVSNHAQRAGAAGDLLTAKGYDVAGAAGSEDYEQAGGKSIAHLQAPPPQVAAAASAPKS